MASGSRDGVIARLMPYKKLVNNPEHKDANGNVFATVGECFVHFMRTNPEFAGCSPKPTADQVDWLFKIYKDLPERKDAGMIYPGGVQPSKRTLKSFVGFTTPEEAFVELIDNVFDNYDEETRDDPKPNPLTISILIQDKFPGRKDGLILMKENSGGIKSDKIVPLIRLGHAKHDYRSIGTWGWGAKLAYHALGQDIEIISQYRDESVPVVLWYPPDWLVEPKEEETNPKDWQGPWYEWAPRECELSAHSLSRVEKGTTITIVNMPRKYGNPPCLITRGRLVKYLSLAFAEKIADYERKNRNISIVVSDGIEDKQVERNLTIEEVIKRECSFIPGLSPVCVRFEWNVEGEESLIGHVYVGLTVSGKTNVPRVGQEGAWVSQGIFMWGNDRVFIDHMTKGPERLNDFVYNYRGQNLNPPYDAKMPKPAHPAANRLHIWVRFSSKRGKSIPWSAPRKVRFAKVGNPYVHEVEQDIVDVAIGFADFATKSHKASPNVFLKPFTGRWNSCQPEDRLKLLFPKGFPDKYEDESEIQYKQRLGSLGADSDVQRILGCSVNTDIIYYTKEQFNILKKYDQLQFRRKDFVREVLRRMIAVNNNEYPSAELAHFWAPFFKEV